MAALELKEMPTSEVPPKAVLTQVEVSSAAWADELTHALSVFKQSEQQANTALAAEML